MALRAVPTIDMLKAPNRLVIAPAHDDPSRPVKLKKRVFSASTSPAETERKE